MNQPQTTKNPQNLQGFQPLNINQQQLPHMHPVRTSNLQQSMMMGQMSAPLQTQQFNIMQLQPRNMAMFGQTHGLPQLYQQQSTSMLDQQPTFTLEEIQNAQRLGVHPEQEQAQLHNQQVLLCKLLSEDFNFNQLDNLTPQQLELLKNQLPDNMDNQVEQFIQHQLNRNGESVLMQIQSGEHDQFNQFQEIQRNLELQAQQQQLGEFVDINQNQYQGQQEEYMQLMDILQSNNLTVEQIQELADKGYDINQLAMELMHNNQPELMQYQHAQISQQEFLIKQLQLQHPHMDEKQILEYIQTLSLEQLQQIFEVNDLGLPEDQMQMPNNSAFLMNQFAQQIQKSEANLSENEFNAEEKLNEENRMKDMYFEQQLRIFYKNLIERLPNSTMDKVAKKSKQFCEQINKVQLEYIQQKKLKKKQAAENGENVSESHEPKEPGEENDADSSFYSVLYGENSTLNPDPFISEILNCLSNHQDLKTQFKQFLPEDEEELQQLEQNLQKIKQSMSIDDVPMGTELDRTYDEQHSINKLKRDAYQNLFKLLTEYQNAKDSAKTFLDPSKQKTLCETLKLTGIKMIKIAENYQKYVTDEIRYQMEQNKDKIDEINYQEYLENQMSMILGFIPQEVINSYQVQEIKPPTKQQTHRSNQVVEEKPAKGRGGKRRAAMQPQISQDEEESNPEVEEEVEEPSESNQEEMEEAQEEVEEEMEEEVDEEEAEASQTEEVAKETEPSLRMKSLMSELSKKYPQCNKDLNKHELKVFENLHKQMRSEMDWMNFCKLLMLYLEGVINLKSLYEVFEEKFGTKIKEDLQHELEQLFPTRDHNRRLASDLLKPWNDHENQRFQKLTHHTKHTEETQKFEKMHDISYFKIDEHFPLPICSERDNPVHGGFYLQLLNNRYLSLSMGLENFKFKWRNANEEAIFKNEDDMYKLDTQIEIFEKCRLIIDQEIKIYDDMKITRQQKQYEFPIHKLKPMMYYWEKKYLDALMLILKPKQQFNREFLVCLQNGLGGKLQELQNYKLDQISTFQDVYRKNYIKSLDHRSFLYKDFMKKYQQKQTHLTKIKEVAEANQSGVRRHVNLMKGGNHHDSPFFHSFDVFLTQGLDVLSETESKDFPINMDYPNIENLMKLHPAKFPHQRLVMNDLEALNITIKLICLNIKFSGAFYNNDKPRLIENLRFIIQDFLGVNYFKQLNSSCGHGKVECLSQKQIDALIAKDSHFYYKMRSVQANAIQLIQDEEDIKNFSQSLKPLQIQINQTDLADQNLSPTKSDKLLSPSIQKSVSDLKEGSDQSSPVQKSESFMQEKEVSNDQVPQLKTAPTKNWESQCFYPHFDKDKDYKLFYSTYHVYVFIKFFHAIYERVLKSKELVYDKVQTDLAEIPLHEKKTFHIIDKKTGKHSQKLVTLFSEERYEFFTRGIFTLTAQQSGQSTGPTGSNPQTAAQQALNVLDQNKFEDFSRILLGKNAFILFHIDKLLNQALKQLQQMNNDNQCQQAVKIYKRLQLQNEKTSESQYMTIYAHEAVEKFNLKENMANVRSFKKNAGCGHAANKFAQRSGLESEQMRQTRSEVNTANSSLSLLNQSNFQVFRLLYSQESKVLSIHYLNLNPYSLPILTYRQQMKDNFNNLTDVVYMPPVPEKSDGNDNCTCKPNKLTQDNVQPPVFLKRNLKQMMKHRDKQLLNTSSTQHNNLQIEVVPLFSQISYSENGEDIFEFKRIRKSGPNGVIVNDLQKQVDTNTNILNKIRKIQRRE